MNRDFDFILAKSYRTTVGSFANIDFSPSHCFRTKGFVFMDLGLKDVHVLVTGTSYNPNTL